MIRYDRLFTPEYIGKIKIKNRVVLSPMTTCYAARDGSVTRRLLDYYRERAKGGTGLIIVEGSSIDDKASRFMECQIAASDNSYIPGLSTLARVIKDYGALAGIQICHAGRQRFTGTYPEVAPSRIPWLEYGGGLVPTEVTIEEIRKIIEAFGNTARIVEQAGFDMVEIHGAHGYLVSSFLSPYTNRRGDIYGGNLSDRMRFALEIVTSIRKNVSRDFPIGMKISGSDYMEGGVTIEDSKILAMELEKAGINVIHVSGGIHQTTSYEVAPMLRPNAIHAHLAEAIKGVVQIPVIASGSIAYPHIAEEVLAKGQAHFISLARPLLADPWWANKAKEGQTEDITPCIRCNDGCLAPHGINLGRTAGCTVNVTAGFEGELEIKPADTVKKIVIIGGGPGGMEAARVSALRGHDVTIYDNKKQLGGRLIGMSGLMADMATLVEYLSEQLKKLEVKMITSKVVTAQVIDEQGYDAVVMATGRNPLIPDIRGVNKPSIITIDSLWEGKEVGKNVVIIGGGLVGCETAYFLALAGKLYGLSKYRKIMSESTGQQLTRLLMNRKLPESMRKNIRIIEPSEDITTDIEEGTKQVLLEGFAKWGVQTSTGLLLDEVTDSGVITIDMHGEKHEFVADSVVLTGSIPNNELLEELKKAGIPVYPVGDCVEPRKIYDAIHEGFFAGYNL